MTKPPAQSYSPSNLARLQLHSQSTWSVGQQATSVRSAQLLLSIVTHSLGLWTRLSNYGPWIQLKTLVGHFERVRFGSTTIHNLPFLPGNRGSSKAISWHLLQPGWYSQVLESYHWQRHQGYSHKVSLAHNVSFCDQKLTYSISFWAQQFFPEFWPKEKEKNNLNMLGIMYKTNINKKNPFKQKLAHLKVFWIQKLT